MVFVPQFRKTHCRQRFDVAGGQNVVEIIARQAPAVDRESVEVNGAALPADEFSEVGFENRLQTPGVDGATAHAAREIRLAIADIGELILDAALIVDLLPVRGDVGESAP